MDFHGINMLGDFYMPRGTTIPTGGLENRLFYKSDSDRIYFDIGDTSIDSISINNGFPKAPGFDPTDSTVIGSLYHKGVPFAPSEGWIPLSDERHWHWSDLVGYNPQYTDNAYGPSNLNSTNVQDAIDEVVDLISAPKEALTVGTGLNYSGGYTTYDTTSPRTINITFSGSGTSTSVARSDHYHSNHMPGAGLAGSYFNGSTDVAWQCDFATSVEDVGKTSSLGSTTTVARGDHIHALDDSQKGVNDIIGFVNKYYSSTYITIYSGAVFINGNTYYLTSALNKYFGQKTANKWYYIYVTEPSSGNNITSSEISFSTSQPSWNTTYNAWYYGSQRAIGFVKTNSSGYVKKYNAINGFYSLDNTVVSDSSYTPTSFTLTSPGDASPPFMEMTVAIRGVVEEQPQASYPQLYVQHGDATSSYSLCRQYTAVASPGFGLIQTNSGGQFYWRCTQSNSATGCWIFMVGFFIPTGFAR